MKIVFLGDAATGKTAFIRRWTKAPFDKRYFATIGCEAHPVGSDLTLIDVTGNEARQGNIQEYIQSADAYVIFFSLQRKSTHKNALEKWSAMVPAGKPMLVVGTFADAATYDVEGIKVSNKTGEGFTAAYHQIKSMC
jgi:GTPase SAR1 family protein